MSDLDSVATALREFASRTLLPKLEERCAKLNAGITATRRGLRNRITRLWKGGATDEAASDKCVGVSLVPRLLSCYCFFAACGAGVCCVRPSVSPLQGGVQLVISQPRHVCLRRPYPWHSIESQMRQLADLAFLLHAYDFAAAT